MRGETGGVLLFGKRGGGSFRGGEGGVVHIGAGRVSGGGGGAKYVFSGPKCLPSQTQLLAKEAQV